MEEKRLLTLTFIVAVVSFGTAEECIKTGECQCKTPSGIVVDLNRLSDSTRRPRFTANGPPGQVFYFNPCKRLTQTLCNDALGLDVSVCQEVSGEGQVSYFDAGDFSTQTFTGDIGNLSLVYSSSVDPGKKRVSMVTLVCSENEQLVYRPENPPGSYYFFLQQSITCPPKEGTGLSLGSILLILFFVVLIVYWVGGLLFMKFVRRAEGPELIPNYEFWKELPLLIRDGISFTMRGCKGESTYEKI